MDFFVSKPLVNIKNGVAGAKPPTGARGGSPSNIAPFRGKGFGVSARMQSPQSVLIGIENLLYFYKYRLFLQTESTAFGQWIFSSVNRLYHQFIIIHKNCSRHKDESNHINLIISCLCCSEVPKAP